MAIVVLNAIMIYLRHFDRDKTIITWFHIIAGISQLIAIVPKIIFEIKHVKQGN